MTITCPLAVLCGPTLVELGKYLQFYREEHGVSAMNLPDVKRLLMECPREAVADAICHAGVSACYGVWVTYLGTAISGETDTLTADAMLERLRNASCQYKRPSGTALQHDCRCSLPPANPVSMHVRQCKRQAFGHGMAGDFTRLFVFHRLSDVWDARGSVIRTWAGDPGAKIEGAAAWVRETKQRVQALTSDDGLRRLFRVSGLAIATALSCAFDAMEVLARKRPHGLAPSASAIDLALCGLKRISRPIAWDPLVALATELRGSTTGT